MIPDKWIQKHTKESNHFLKNEKKKPGPSSYRPLSAGTFDRRSFDIATDRKKRNKSLNKSFGVDAKFVYERADKKKIKEKRPDPLENDVFDQNF